MTGAWFRYVPHASVAAYEAIGWVAHDGLEGTSHGHWSVLMEYGLPLPDTVAPPTPSEVQLRQASNDQPTTETSQNG